MCRSFFNLKQTIGFPHLWVLQFYPATFPSTAGSSTTAGHLVKPLRDRVGRESIVQAMNRIPPEGPEVCRSPVEVSIFHHFSSGPRYAKVSSKSLLMIFDYQWGKTWKTHCFFGYPWFSDAAKNTIRQFDMAMEITMFINKSSKLASVATCYFTFWVAVSIPEIQRQQEIPWKANLWTSSALGPWEFPHINPSAKPNEVI